MSNDPIAVPKRAISQGRKVNRFRSIGDFWHVLHIGQSTTHPLYRNVHIAAHCRGGEAPVRWQTLASEWAPIEHLAT